MKWQCVLTWAWRAVGWLSCGLEPGLPFLEKSFLFLMNEAYILMTYLSDSVYVRPVESVFQGFKVLLLFAFNGS